MNLEQRRDEFYRKRQVLQDAVLDYVVPIYGVSDSSVPQVVGSGTLIDIERWSFLATAAHVLDENEQSTLYLPGSPLVTIVGPATKTRAPLGNRKKDTIDLAIVKLERELVERVTNVGRIGLHQLDPFDTPTSNADYAFVGCPSAQNKLRPGRKLQLSATIISVLPLSAERYAEVGAQEGVHFAGSFDREKVMDRRHKQITAPDPHGMSGGGVWRIGTYGEIDAGSAKPMMVGVGIEHHRNPKILLGVRVSLLIAALANFHPEIASLLPSAPPHLRINVKTE